MGLIMNESSLEGQTLREVVKSPHRVNPMPPFLPDLWLQTGVKRGGRVSIKVRGLTLARERTIIQLNGASGETLD
jgi:hypothetical protein